MTKQRVIEMIEDTFELYQGLRWSALEKHDVVSAKLAEGGLQALGYLWKKIQEEKDDGHHEPDNDG